MIVDDDDRVGGIDQRRAEDLARMSDAFVHAAERDFLDAEQVQFGVEQDDAQRFAVQRAHLARRADRRSVAGVSSGCRCEAFAREPRGQAERGGELHRLRRADAFDPRKLRHGAAREAAEGCEIRARSWRATSTAFAPGRPVRSRMAISSLSLSAAAPSAASFSRGRSSSGSSWIRKSPCAASRQRSREAGLHARTARSSRPAS